MLDVDTTSKVPESKYYIQEQWFGNELMITDTDENQGKSQEIGLILFKDIWDFN